MTRGIKDAIVLSKKCQEWAQGNGHAEDLAVTRSLLESYREANPSTSAPYRQRSVAKLEAMREKYTRLTSELDTQLARRGP